MNSQSPAEALRQDLANCLRLARNHKNDTDMLPLLADLERFVTAYTATVEREARKDELERLQATFGDRGILTFADTDYEEEAEIVITAHFLNKISDRLAALQGPQEQDDTPASS